MPKFFCDYCDVYLTHDSMSVRKAHNSGRNHLRNVVDYYQQIGHEKAQSVIDSITSSYAAEGQAHANPMLPTTSPAAATSVSAPTVTARHPATPFPGMPGLPGMPPPFPAPGAAGGSGAAPPFPFPPPFPGAAAAGAAAPGGGAPPFPIPPPFPPAGGGAPVVVVVLLQGGLRAGRRRLSRARSRLPARRAGCRFLRRLVLGWVPAFSAAAWGVWWEGR
ncbi:hypothetical protein NEMBOFW57_004955 [Staphylotrichum longicolle]|uniref:U1 small nuclear ribonucleoprotein C n=1 Tax=Staphylotrichum longicolle TaxID=669026 RepID=A0AAD4HZ65_9PEZI|nr:hypothetical protein NEMBOFW57_004955 [Staphylotrichum longicolle]